MIPVNRALIDNFCSFLMIILNACLDGFGWMSDITILSEDFLFIMIQKQVLSNVFWRKEVSEWREWWRITIGNSMIYCYQYMHHPV